MEEGKGPKQAFPGEVFAKGNPALPPQSTTAAVKAIEKDGSLFVKKAKKSSTGYKVRGEKQWQKWAADLETYGDKQEKKANTRIPYHSTL